jgi:hypothetical protein
MMPSFPATSLKLRCWDFAFWLGLKFGINDGWHEQRSEAGGFGIYL